MRRRNCTMGGFLETCKGGERNLRVGVEGGSMLRRRGKGSGMWLSWARRVGESVCMKGKCRESEWLVKQ